MLSQDSIKLFELSQHCKSAGSSAKSHEVILWLLPNKCARDGSLINSIQGLPRQFHWKLLPYICALTLYFHGLGTNIPETPRSCPSVRDTWISVRLAWGFSPVGRSPRLVARKHRWMSTMKGEKHMQQEALQVPAQAGPRMLVFQDGVT